MTSWKYGHGRLTRRKTGAFKIPLMNFYNQLAGILPRGKKIWRRRSLWCQEAERNGLCESFPIRAVCGHVVNFKQESAIVLVSEPGSGRPWANPGLKASCAEKMTQGMGGKPLDAKFLAGAVDNILRRLDQQHAGFRRTFLAPGLALSSGSCISLIVKTKRGPPFLVPRRRTFCARNQPRPKDTGRFGLPRTPESDQLDT